MPPADRINLTGSQRRELKRLIRAGRTEQRMVIRAKIVLAAADGHSNAATARLLAVGEDTVRKWRDRLVRRTRSGVAGRRETVRPPAEVHRSAGRAGQGDRLHPVPGGGAAAGAVVVPGAGPPRRQRRGVRVDLADNGASLAVRGRDQTLAVPVVDLHHRPRLRGQGIPGARPVRPNLGRETFGAQRLRDFRRREDLHPGPLPLPPHPGPRRGAGDAGQSRLRPWRRGRLPGRLRRAPWPGVRPLRGHHRHRTVQPPRRAGHDLRALRLRRALFWIVDNGSSHRGQKAVDRLAAQHPNAIMVHTPVHASWLNQIEIYFSIVQRKVVSPNDFTELDEVIYRLARFEKRYNHTALPFKWKFTTIDLDDLLNRLDNHTPESEHDPAQPRAA